MAAESAAAGSGRHVSAAAAAASAPRAARRPCCACGRGTACGDGGSCSRAACAAPSVGAAAAHTPLCAGQLRISSGRARAGCEGAGGFEAAAAEGTRIFIAVPIAVPIAMVARLSVPMRGTLRPCARQGKGAARVVLAEPLGWRERATQPQTALMGT
eukprot:195529-Chlamydomonas_euryale.AAC.5